MDARDPDIHLAGLSMWIDGYQYPLASNYWDANWVVVRAICIGERSTVELRSPCIMAPDLARWLDACVRMDAGETEAATLDSVEPYLQVTVDRSGECAAMIATVKLTPDNTSEFHEFRYSVDRSYLPRLITSLRVLLQRVPVRESRP